MLFCLLNFVSRLLVVALFCEILAIFHYSFIKATAIVSVIVTMYHIEYSDLLCLKTSFNKSKVLNTH